MSSKRDIRLVLTILMAVALVLILRELSIAGSLEPPTSAVDGSGNPVPTTMTPPSWSKKLPASERFVVLADFNNEAVLDKETGLVWEQSPSTAVYDWYMAQIHCYMIEKANRKGWHLPTVEQLASLVDTSVTGSPKLPSGHPFTNVQIGYWSSTTYADDTSIAWRVAFGGVGTPNAAKAGNDYVWCVRGGQSHDAY